VSSAGEIDIVNQYIHFRHQYDILPKIRKLELYWIVMSNTKTDDLKQHFWLNNPNAEIWLTQRTNYIKSLAVMSIVGYILGLGDRHLCNIMIQKSSGKIVHIDFGDCFEVTRKREKLPEKVPFRLTRVLINAMEASGIHGTFKHTCEIVMKLLRDNKDSLLAILEEFIIDPLVSFRLTDTIKKEKKKGNSEREKSEHEHKFKETQNPGFEKNEKMEIEKRSGEITKISNKLCSIKEEEASLETNLRGVPDTKQNTSNDANEYFKQKYSARVPQDELNFNKNSDEGKLNNSKISNSKLSIMGPDAPDRVNRKRANAKNTSFEIEKSVIEETVREFEKIDISKKVDEVDIIKNSKEDHRDIHFKMKFENEEEEEIELQNKMAMQAIRRITKKFQGKDFENPGSLNAFGYKAQVERLIREASDPYNLCQSYSGWNPFL
jgi:phosphatidylinositol kinase/protein kinase (PI-3  family)